MQPVVVLEKSKFCVIYHLVPKELIEGMSEYIREKIESVIQMMSKLSALNDGIYNLIRLKFHFIRYFCIDKKN